MGIFGQDSISEQVAEYLELQKEKVILGFVDKTSKVMAKIAFRLTYVFCGIFSIFFLSLGFASLINIWLESMFYGYLIVALIYFLALIFLIFKGQKLMSRFLGWIMLSIVLDEERK